MKAGPSVEALRVLSSAGLMDCADALKTAEGDTLRALTILRRKGQAVRFSNPEKQRAYFNAEDVK